MVESGRILVVVLTAIMALATALPKIPWPNGLVRVSEFPRAQIAALTVALMPVTVWSPFTYETQGALLVTQLIVLVVQVKACALYTPVARVQSLRGEAGSRDQAVRILTCNVLMSNRRHEAVLDLIGRADPDIAILLEIDDAWAEALSPLASRLPHRLSWTCDNTYGMLVMSRLPLSETEIRFLVFENVPSIRARVELPGGDFFRLFAVHPEPPMPYEDSIGRDGELAMVALEVAKDSLPAIVTGDLNDVAWSRTTRRFQRLSGLLDPRVGRGFYSTFDARIPVLRWPLDHLFHSPRFRLVRIERLPYVGSDHFPMLFELVLTQEMGRNVAKPDAQDIEEAAEVSSAANGLERGPIGET